ncbi:MAG: lysozyme [Sneathiella sp.]
MREALRLIKKYEGLGDGDKLAPGLQPYICPAGVWTIGFGSIYGLDRKRVTASTQAISEGQAELLVLRDMQHAERAVRRLVKVPINQNQVASLTSFTFNLGAGALKSSTLLRRVNQFEWDDVPRQFQRWVFAGGRKLPGLVKRRREEALVWEKGV